MPRAASSSAAPIPESCRSWGELMAPPERITSLVARTRFVLPPWTYSTPTAACFSEMMRVVRAFVSTERLVLVRAGLR